MNQSHTPGPWTTSPCWDGHYPDAFTISAPLTGTTTNERGLIACTVGSPFVEQQEANARFIAAAPETMAALLDLLDQLEAVGIYLPGEDAGQWADASGLSFRLAESAISKAKGTK